MRRASLVLAAVVSGAAWGCGSSTEPPPPTATTITLSAGAGALDAIGATRQYSATVKDQNGATLPGQTLTWTSDNAGVASVDGNGLVTAVAHGTASISAAVGSVKGTATVTVQQVPTTMLKVSGDSQTAMVHSAVANPLVARVADRLAQPIAGVVVTFSSSAGGGTPGATSDTTDASGQVSTTWTLGAVAGAQHVTFAVAGTAASAVFAGTATPAPADSMAIAGGNNQSAAPGTAERDSIVVLVMDAYGTPVSGTRVAFSVTGGGGSVSPDTAVSDANGHASARWTVGALGAQTLQATATGLKGSPLTFSGTATNITASAVLPDTMVEGASATVTGAGFDANLANDAVTVDGLSATILAATATSITFTVPTAACKPARSVEVQVTVNGVDANALTHAVRPVYLNLSVGQQAILQAPAGFCLQIAPSTVGGDGYLIGVGAAAEASALNAYVMTASAGPAPSPSVVPQATVVGASPAPRAAQPMTPLEREMAESWDRQRVAEGRIRAFEQEFMRTHPRPRMEGRPARQLSGSPASMATVPNMGDTLSLKVPVGPSNYCTQYDSIKAVVKAVGTHGIWVSDLKNPVTSDSLTDAEIQAYSDTLDTKIYATDVDWFGAPSDIDQNGRILIVLTYAVNTAGGGGIAGFVFSGDLYPAAQCASSNFGEIFYGNVPNPTDTNARFERQKSSVVRQLPSLIAHEFTHDIQNSRRLIISPTAGTNTTLNAWEAEGQAVFAQNAVGDDVLGNASGNNYGWTTAHTGQGGRWYGQAFDELAAYYGLDYDGSHGGEYANAPEQCTLFGTGLGGASACYSGAFYGASYAFQKYITDRFGPGYVGGEKQLQRDVIYKNPGLAGRANWEALLGLSDAGFDSVFSQWAAMLWVDDSVPGIPAALQMQSWNLANIFGATGYLGTSCGTNCVLKPQVEAWGAFTQSRSVKDGSNAYTLLTSSGAHAALSIKVRDGSDNPLATGMRPQLWIVRIQ